MEEGSYLFSVEFSKLYKENAVIVKITVLDSRVINYLFYGTTKGFNQSSHAIEWSISSVKIEGMK